MKYTDIRTTVTVADLKHGDTVEINGITRTVNRRDVRYDPFMGWSYQGDPHRHGITRVTFGAEIARRERARAAITATDAK